MGKTLAELKKELKDIEDDVNVHWKTVKTYEQNRLKTMELYYEAADSMGERAQVLKQQGFTGDTVAHFVGGVVGGANDPEMKKLSQRCGELTVDLAKQCKEMSDLNHGKFKTTAEEFKELQSQLDEEIKHLERANPKDPKLKDYKDLKKAAATLRDHKTEFWGFRDQGALKVDLDRLKKIVNDRIKEARTNKEAMLLKQMTEERNLKKHYAHGKRLREDILGMLADRTTQLKKALAAKNAGDKVQENTSGAAAAMIRESVRKNHVELAELIVKFRKIQDTIGQTLDAETLGVVRQIIAFNQNLPNA
jgi:hypothetical protein